MLTPKTKMNLQRVLKETVDAELKRIQDVMPTPQRVDMMIVEDEVKKKVGPELVEAADAVIEFMMQKVYAAVTDEMNRQNINEHADWSVEDIESVGIDVDSNVVEMAKGMVHYDLQEFVDEMIQRIVKGSHRE
jgi:NADH dehydrogenase FAD-containing subunit